MKLTATAGSDFDVPEGIHPARIVWLLDLGWQDTPFGIKEQIFINFETPRGTIGKFYTKSLNEKATLNIDMSGMRGKKIVEGDEVDISKALDKCCTVSVLKNAKGKNVVANVMPQTEPFRGKEEILTEEDANMLPDFFQKLIDRQVANPNAAPSRLVPDDGQASAAAALDDEIPF